MWPTDRQQEIIDALDHLAEEDWWERPKGQIIIRPSFFRLEYKTTGHGEPVLALAAISDPPGQTLQGQASHCYFTFHCSSLLMMANDAVQG